jgi:hypothetical protein
MAVHTSTVSAEAAPPEPQAAVIEEQLVCALTGRPIAREEAYWAPPLITAGQLVSATLQTLTRSPGSLGHVLFEEQPNVPYAQDARDTLAARRSAEQLKLLVGLLTLAALVCAPVLWLTLG